MAVFKRTLKSGGVRWRARVNPERGGKPITRDFKRKADADDWELQQKAELRGLGAAPGGGEAKASTEKTLADLGRAHNDWFDKAVDQGERARVSLDGYERHLRQVCTVPAIADKVLAEIGTPELQELLEALVLGGLSNETARRIKTSIHAWFMWGATRKEFLSDVTLVKPAKLIKPKKRKQKLCVPGPDDLKAMFAAAREGPDPERDLAVLWVLVCGGLRISEMLGMADDAVKLDAASGFLEVNERLCSHFVEMGDVKTEKSERRVPVGPEVVSALKAWRLRRGPTAGFRAKGKLYSGRLFRGATGPLWRYQRFRRMCWLKLMERAGLGGRIKDAKGIKRPWAKYSPHDMRHAYATMQIAAGVDPKTLQTWMGHATLKETTDTYAEAWELHKNTHLQAAAIERMIPR